MALCMRSFTGTESSGSISSNGSLHSPKDFHEVKELVKDINRRLDALERIFVFVDIDQISEAIANFKVGSANVSKAGSDVAFASSFPSVGSSSAASADALRGLKTAHAAWQPLPDVKSVPLKAGYGDWSVSSGRQPLKFPPQLGVEFQTSKSPCIAIPTVKGRLHPLDPPKKFDTQKLQMRSDGSLISSQVSKISSSPSQTSEAVEPHILSACAVDLNELIHAASTRDEPLETTDDNLSSRKAPCDVETGSRPTSHATRVVQDAAGTTSDNEDIEPERCSNFVRQALQASKAKQAWIDSRSRMRERSAPRSAT